ncbi:MAG TPA: copper transporter, partial [Actinomycetota bacterium]|nr:copper transporter [Actinomycetota bacterium]
MALRSFLAGALVARAALGWIRRDPLAAELHRTNFRGRTVTLATQFAADQPLVVAGDGAIDGSLVAQVRADPTLVKTISTVDNASSTQGQLATALTVVERVVA